nr:unnamed protein product [Callosobruchus analis]
MQEPCTSFTFKMGENELKFTALPRGFCSNCCPGVMERDVRFVAYTRETADSGIEIGLRPGAARKAGVRSDWPTVFFVHGFTELSPGQSGRAIVDAYLSRKDHHNVILVDWSELSTFPWYQTAVENVQKAAYQLADFIDLFNGTGELPIGNVHVVGFSLGSHVAGIAGKTLSDRTLRIPRITALDPALPEFSLNGYVKRITSTDAEYVDVIHTDSGIFGLPISVGHADFYPNGGRALQPGCQPSYLVRQRIIDQVFACSHVRAWKLYAESVRNEKAFPATRCPVWRGLEKRCDFSVDAYMGYINNGKAKGSYFLITHESKPYGRRRKKIRT